MLKSEHRSTFDLRSPSRSTQRDQEEWSECLDCLFPTRNGQELEVSSRSFFVSGFRPKSVSF